MVKPYVKYDIEWIERADGPRITQPAGRGRTGSGWMRMRMREGGIRKAEGGKRKKPTTYNGWPASITAMQEFVVPKSMPKIFAI